MTKPSQPTALDLPMLDPLPEATQKYFDICAEKLGMIPNVLRAYAFDIDKLNAFTTLYNNLMLAESGLSKLEREMIAVEAMANLRQRDGLTGRGGYATGFASLQQRAGAQVTASESRVATAEAEAESAARAESELGGVDLDAEAAQLMQQQQAYQANAQVLSVARSLFDTLLQAI